MFTKLMNLNKLIESNHPKTILERLNQGLPSSYIHGIAICFSPETGQYLGLRTVEGSENVVYREASGSNGYAVTAVQCLSGKSYSTVAKLKRAVADLAQNLPQVEPSLELINKNYIEETITAELEEKIKELNISVDSRGYLFVAFYKENKIIPLYEFPDIQNRMIQKTLTEQYGKAKEYSAISDDKTCSICGTTGRKVYGNFSLLKCYNLDKPGMITGGFSYDETPVRNFPVCEECLTAVSSAKNYVEKYLSFNLCGNSYWLIPEIQVNDSTLSKIILKVMEKRQINSLKTENIIKITGDEKEILEELADASQGNDNVSMTMIFYEESNSSWRILAEIPEVLPSRIHTIYKVKHIIEKNPYLQNKTKKGGFSFTFKTIKQFAGNDFQTSQKKFLKYIEAVFKGEPISYDSFVNDLATGLMYQSKQNPDLLRFTSRDALASWLFMYHLGIIKKETRYNMKEDMFQSGENNYAQFLNNHKDYFDCNEKIVAFLTGCYISKVLDAQQSKLSNSPFFKKLRGLKIDKKRLESLYPEARNKIQQYDAFGLVKEIDSMLAQKWIECGNQWNISDSETTLAFTLGISLDYQVNNVESN
jgi:CRISPR-associated protein Csh1